MSTTETAPGEEVANPNFDKSYLPENSEEQPPISREINLVTRNVRSSKTVTGLPVITLDRETGTSQKRIIVVTPMSPLQRWLHFSTKKVIGGGQLWRLVGFQFLHADMTHLLFNMVALFFFGPLVERFLGGKRYLAFYLLCGVFGSFSTCSSTWRVGCGSISWDGRRLEVSCSMP